MRLRRDDLPNMEKGESRYVTIKIDGPIGSLTVSSSAVTTEGSGITFGTPADSTKETTFLLTASQTGTHYAECAFTLSNGEIAITPFRVKVGDWNKEQTNTDYR